MRSLLSMRSSANVSTITSHNVAGIVPGSKYPDETVIYTAHWDHLGIGTPVNGDANITVAVSPAV